MNEGTWVQGKSMNVMHQTGNVAWSIFDADYGKYNRMSLENGTGGDMEVTVTITDGKISDIVVNSHAESSDIGAPALDKLIQNAIDHLLTNREGYTSLSRLAAGLSDTPVTLAAKSLLRVGCPVVLAVSTNDGLGASGENIARLFQRKHYYFVPYGQDDPAAKPQSLKADFARLPAALEAALHGEQLQPVLLGQRERAMAFQPGQNVVY